MKKSGKESTTAKPGSVERGSSIDDVTTQSTKDDKDTDDITHEARTSHDCPARPPGDMAVSPQNEKRGEKAKVGGSMKERALGMKTGAEWCKLGETADLSTFDEADIHILHEVFFKKAAKTAEEELKNVLDFEGFKFEENSKEFTEGTAAFLRYHAKDLRKLCSSFGIDDEGNPEQLTERIMHFLLKSKDAEPTSNPAKKLKIEEGEAEQEDDDYVKGSNNSNNRNIEHGNGTAGTENTEDEDEELDAFHLYLLTRTGKPPLKIDSRTLGELCRDWNSLSYTDRGYFQRLADKQAGRDGWF